MCSCCQQASGLPLLGWWIITIVLIAVIGALSMPPPESLNQVFTHDHSKIQYITIGGATQAPKYSTN
jgi:hypothetical protein|nr:MAG: hypothetical protein 3 [Betanecrovirus sp.]UHS72391.1 MAG: hypothetical protein 3 [Betanecrovirus sp.]